MKIYFPKNLGDTERIDQAHRLIEDRLLTYYYAKDNLFKVLDELKKITKEKEAASNRNQ